MKGHSRGAGHGPPSVIVGGPTVVSIEVPQEDEDGGDEDPPPLTLGGPTWVLIESRSAQVEARVPRTAGGTAQTRKNVPERLPGSPCARTTLL